MQKTIFTIISIFAFALMITAQENYLERVSELQKTAESANRGIKGCGIGTMTLVTSNGDITFRTGLDPIFVFGKKAVVADLVKILEARIESNRTGVENQMSGEVDDLIYVILSVLSYSKDAKIIPFVSELLNDKNEVVRGWAFINLKTLAESDEKLLKVIKNIEFPSLAVESGRARGVEKPDWLKIKE